MLEPGAGSGNIIKTLQKYGDFSIDAVEIRPEETEHLQQLGVNVIIGDYLSMNIGKKYDLIQSVYRQGDGCRRKGPGEIQRENPRRLPRAREIFF